MISVVTPVFNEEENVEDLYGQVRQAFKDLPQHSYEHIFIDNASKDRTAEILRRLAAADHNVKVILNNRNFGHIRSPYHALLQARGDAVIIIAGDLQDPPHLIKDFVAKWEEGHKVVLGIKDKSEETLVMSLVRKAYYHLLYRLADFDLPKNNTGFGLYDRVVVESLRQVGDVYPYLRGLISEFGYKTAQVQYTQPTRKRGISKNNFYTLYDIAMLGITSHTKVPLRIATMTGFFLSSVCFMLAVGYIIAKLLFWSRFPLGTAPMIIGVFFGFSIILFFIGLIGEYVGAIHTQVLHRPLVTERERLNFEADPKVANGWTTLAKGA